MTTPLVPELLALDAVERSDGHRRVEGRDRCLNCGAVLTGPFCAQCGQFDAPADPTLRELLADAWDALTSLDGKLAASLRLLLTRPGGLTAEFFAGRRTRYLPPFRLYLVCSVLYFLVSAAVPDEPKSTERERTAREETRVRKRYAADTAGARRAVDSMRAAHAADSLQGVAVLDSSRRATLASIGRPAGAAPLDSAQRARADSVRIDRKLARATGGRTGWFARATVGRFMRNSADDGRKKERDMGADIRRNVPRMMFVLMPVLAALLAVAYRSRRRRYPSHLVVSLHLHAFVFATLTLLDVASLVPERPAALMWLGYLLTAPLAVWLFAYVPLALRRVYGGRLRWALVRATTIASVYALVSLLATVALIVVLIWSY